MKKVRISLIMVLASLLTAASVSRNGFAQENWCDREQSGIDDASLLAKKVDELAKRPDYFPTLKPWLAEMAPRLHSFDRFLTSASHERDYRYIALGDYENGTEALDDRVIKCENPFSTDAHKHCYFWVLGYAPYFYAHEVGSKLATLLDAVVNLDPRFTPAADISSFANSLLDGLNNKFLPVTELVHKNCRSK